MRYRDVEAIDLDATRKAVCAWLDEHQDGTLAQLAEDLKCLYLGQGHVLGARRMATSGPITYLAIENQFPGCWAMRAPASEYGTSSPLIGATVCPAQVVRDLLLLG
jgi:hypothetical protein